VITDHSSNMQRLNLKHIQLERMKDKIKHLVMCKICRKCEILQINEIRVEKVAFRTSFSLENKGIYLSFSM
jgi:hypothetical protein